MLPSPDAVILRYTLKSPSVESSYVSESFLFMWGIVGTDFRLNFRATFRRAPVAGFVGLKERWLRLREHLNIGSSLVQIGFRVNAKC